MSETNKKSKNPAIACTDIETDGNKIFTKEKGKYGPAKNDIINLSGMEIQVEGYEIVYDDKTGKLLRVQDKRTINEISNDEKRKKIMEYIKREEKDYTI